MLTSKEKKKLRSIAQTRKALVQVGKDGMTKNVVQSLDVALEAHELVKVSVSKNCMEDFKELSFDMAALTRSEIVQTIGKTFTVYRRSKKNLMEL